jgi:hypothetical protein
LNNFANAYELDLPPYSVTALTWEVAALKLTGAVNSNKIYLNWTVNVSLPITSTWTISYTGGPGTPASPITGLLNSMRVYTLTGLTNYTWYTVTLSTLLESMSVLSDTVRFMPTDRLVYLPVILK